MVYSISYDLYAPNQQYEKLHELIAQVSENNYCNSLKSTYIIKSDKTANDIRNFLSKALDKNDYIFVSEIASNYSGFLDSKSADLINSFFD